MHIDYIDSAAGNSLAAQRHDEEDAAWRQLIDGTGEACCPSCARLAYFELIHGLPLEDDEDTPDALYAAYCASISTSGAARDSDQARMLKAWQHALRTGRPRTSPHADAAWQLLAG